MKQKNFYVLQRKQQHEAVVNIFVVHASDKGLISKICKELQKLNNKTNNPVKTFTKHVNRYLSNDEIQVANRHMTKGSESLVNKEIQMKTNSEVSSHDRMAIIQKSKKEKHPGGDVGKNQYLIHCWQEYKLMQPLWNMTQRFPRNLKI